MIQRPTLSSFGMWEAHNLNASPVQAARCAGVAFHAKPVVGTMAIELKIAIVTEALRSLIMDFSSFVRGRWAGCPVLR
jgi:hypothetical protein